MNLSDPIADMLTRIRNANSANKATVSMPSSKKLVEIARVMKEEGYIAEYIVEPGTPHDDLVITLKYGERHAKVIRGIRRISKPGLRVYVGKEKLPRVLGGLGIAIISTSHGLMTDRDARKLGVGGEVVAYVW
jgi:small subunit ribosomal protein S8